MLGYPRRLKRRVVPVVEWLLEIGDGTDDAVEYHLARCDAVAQSDGGVLGVGFVYVGEDVGKLGAVIGDLEDVELCLANEVGDVSGCVGDVAWLVEPGGSVLRQAQDRFLRLRRPFDGAQNRPFDGAQDRPFDGARDRPFDGAQDRIALRMSGVLLSRWLRRTECVVELLLESCGGSVGRGGRFANICSN